MEDDANNRGSYPQGGAFLRRVDQAMHSVEAAMALVRALEHSTRLARRQVALAAEVALATGWTQAQIAERLGVSQQRVSRMLRDGTDGE